MKKQSGASMSVMLALLAVLLVSLAFLSSQGSGMEGMATLRKKGKMAEETKTEGFCMIDGVEDKKMVQSRCTGKGHVWKN